MGTLGTIAISLLIGATLGFLAMAIFVKSGETVKGKSEDIKAYCKGKACKDCCFHQWEEPYCKLGYPFRWDIGEQKEEE